MFQKRITISRNLWKAWKYLLVNIEQMVLTILKTDKFKYLYQQPLWHVQIFCLVYQDMSKDIKKQCYTFMDCKT